MTKFIFDLDGTVTKDETLPIIARHFGIEKEIASLTKDTVEGRIPFVESFIKRVYILGKFPVNEIAELLGKVRLYQQIKQFINTYPDNCCIATGNLQDWIAKLSNQFDCEIFCSQGKIANNKVEKLTNILMKESVVNRYKAEGHRVVFIGDGNNDVEAMRCADVAVASGITHLPALGVLSVADYLIMDEVTLCRQLKQLL